MKTRSNIIIALLVILGASSQLVAQEMQQQNGPKGERPDFTSIDIDNSGDIDFDEFLQQKLPHGDHQTVFDDMDKDGDGYITEEEFKNHKPPRPPKRD
ncbi:EF-hand domain-containing protein [Psychromonas algarum]|uniref:EF-hand domain-containing protein n=1 Tax=Psychromonas algarum TaxID=2555643 RepID=UPI001419D598|nr:EF-hand domain-containing protein [Psychromonas sp. RZ22]